MSLEDKSAYQRWRTEKLADYPTSVDEVMVEIQDPRGLSTAERHKMLALCAKTNLCLYTTAGDQPAPKTHIRQLGQQIGLHDLDSNLYADQDSITSLRATAPTARQFDYIPYTDKPLNWHTDGYYNSGARRIGAFIMHCVTPAATGGDNAFLDPEIAYLLLRDAAPAHIAALMRADAMTIPANVENGVEIRPAETGPVFCVDEKGALHMRYTARKRSIQWKPDDATQTARQFLETLLADITCPYIFHYRFSRGQGIACNNVLHNRSGFVDAPDASAQRLIYRARYYDRIAVK